MPKAEDYANALRELEDLHNTGRLDDASYQVHRVRLLQESTKPRLRWWQVPINILGTLGIMFIFVLVLMAVAN